MPLRLIEQREEEMFVRDLLLPSLRRDVLRSLDRFLHFLGELVDAHSAAYEARTSTHQRFFLPFRVRPIDAQFHRVPWRKQNAGEAALTEEGTPSLRQRWSSSAAGSPGSYHESTDEESSVRLATIA